MHLQKTVFVLLTAIFLHSCGTMQGIDSQLHIAAHQGNVDVLREALADGANINAVSSNRWTPLHVAASAGQLDVVKYLVRHGAKIDAIADGGWIAQDEAKFSGHLEIHKWLGAVAEKQKTEQLSLITKFNTLLFSRRRGPIYSQWFEKYPLPHRFHWRNPLQTLDIYLQNTLPQYLAAADYRTHLAGVQSRDVSLLQNEFESNQSYASRQGDVEYQLYDRRVRYNDTKLLLIADALQWMLKEFKLRKSSYNPAANTVVFEIYSTGGDFQEQIQAPVNVQAPVNSIEMAKSIVYNPSVVTMDVYFDVFPDYFKLKKVVIYHRGFLLNAKPTNVTKYQISTL